jgi:hypothetical protein
MVRANAKMPVRPGCSRRCQFPSACSALLRSRRRGQGPTGRPYWLRYRERVGARRPGQTDGRGRCVLLVVRVQDQDAVQGAQQHVVDLVLFARVGKHHVHEVGAVRQVVAWVHERLTDVVLIGHRDHVLQLGDQADCRDFALLGIVDVELA